MDFFEDLGNKITQTYNAASEKTGKIAKEAKLKSNIADANGKINEEYKKIGKKIYEEYLNRREEETVAGLIEEFKEIDKNKEEIAKAEDEILALKDRRKCINCGTEFETKYEYCPKCGTKNNVTVKNIENEKENK